jgi:hypothetical protein
VVEAARRQGIDVNRPFPFLVKGTVAEAKYYVVRHPGDLKDPQDLHDKAKSWPTAGYCTSTRPRREANGRPAALGGPQGALRSLWTIEVSPISLSLGY